MKNFNSVNLFASICFFISSILFVPLSFADDDILLSRDEIAQAVKERLAEVPQEVIPGTRAYRQAERKHIARYNRAVKQGRGEEFAESERPGTAAYEAAKSEYEKTYFENVEAEVVANLKAEKAAAAEQPEKVMASIVMVKAILSGSVYGGSISTDLNGLAGVPAMPFGGVDLVTLELLDDLGNVLESADGVALNTQSVVTLGGTAFTFNTTGRVYMRIRHRNHLSVVSGAFWLDGSQVTVDFTDDTQLFGSDTFYNKKTIEVVVDNEVKQALVAGDADQDGIVDASDRSIVWNNRNNTGYDVVDINLDGIVDSTDRSVVWDNRNSTVPEQPIYFALGDSYASGTGDLTQTWVISGNSLTTTLTDKGYSLDTNPNGNSYCLRSPSAYARQPAFMPQRIDFVACSGARIEHIRDVNYQGDNPQKWIFDPTYGEENSTDQRIITMSIGGNDLGFADVLYNCTTNFPPWGSCLNNASNIAPVVDNLPKLRDPIESIYLPNIYMEVLDAATANSATAPTLFVIGYPLLFNNTPWCTAASNAGMIEPERIWADQTSLDLAQAIEDSVADVAALGYNIHYVETRTVFDGHEVCPPSSDADRWINNFSLLGLQDNAYHPNEQGHLAIAKRLREIVLEEY